MFQHHVVDWWEANTSPGIVIIIIIKKGELCEHGCDRIIRKDRYAKKKVSVGV